MKKIILLLPLLLSSCQKPKFKFEDKYYSEDNPGLIELNDISLFQDLENNKESFGIYIYLPGCITCSKFKPILEEFLVENNVQMYSISYTKIKKDRNTLYQKIEVAPSVALFNKGKLITYLDAYSDDHIKYYETVEGFSEWFYTYIER